MTRLSKPDYTLETVSRLSAMAAGASEFYLMRPTPATQYIPHPWTCRAIFSFDKSKLEIVGEGETWEAAVERAHEKYQMIDFEALREVEEIARIEEPEVEDEIPF